MKMEEMTYEQLQDTHELLDEIRLLVNGRKGFYKVVKDRRTHLVSIQCDEIYVAVDEDHEDARAWSLCWDGTYSCWEPISFSCLESLNMFRIEETAYGIIDVSNPHNDLISLNDLMLETIGAK